MPRVGDIVHYVVQRLDNIPPECRAAIVTYTRADQPDRPNLRVLDLDKQEDWDTHAAPRADWTGPDSQVGAWHQTHGEGDGDDE